jgi:hypothetical protein
MKPKHWLAVLIVLAALILSACTIDISVAINADGSGSLGMTYKLTAEDLKSLEGMGVTKDTICTQMESDNEFTFTQETHGDEIWCVATKPVADLITLKGEMGGDGFTVNQLDISSGKFTFDADADMSQQGQDTSGFDLSMLQITYSMTAPGKVTNHNGDSITGNTVTWKLPLGATKNLHLESKVGSSGSFDFGGMGGGGNVPYLVIGLLTCCCCLVVIIVIVVVMVLVMRRKKNTDLGVGSV